MKVGIAALAALRLLAFLATSDAIRVQQRDQAAMDESTITKVVKLLQGMLDKSKTEADAERDLFAKFKCYCDSNEAEKTTSISDLGNEIGLLGSKIEALQGSSGVLSSECAKLKSEMDANRAAKAAAVSMRAKVKTAFEAEEADLVAAIGQLGEAVNVLAAIGADQSLGASADHDEFMAGHSASLLKAKTSISKTGISTISKPQLLAIQNAVNAAYLAAKGSMAPAAQKKVESFLQGVDGAYSSNAGEIVGILKEMKSTFESNLESARTNEATAVTAQGKFIAGKDGEHTKMKDSYDEKQGTLGDNDGELSTKKQQLTASTTQKSEDESFLQKLTTQCNDKQGEYEKRKVFRVNEDSALSQAIAILNSDKAFETFGKISATSTGATSATVFLQMSSRSVPLREKVMKLLQKSARSSTRVARIADLLRLGNPFKKVLSSIGNMINLIDKESIADTDQLSWCNSERTANNGNLDSKTGQISTLSTAITNLEVSIDDPETGLRKQVESKEEAISSNTKSQQDETGTRTEDNLVYQKNIANMVQGEILLTKAVKVLTSYYAEVAKAKAAAEEAENSLLQKHGHGKKEEPAPPSTFEGSYKGQTDTGNSVIAQLEYVLTQSKTEETAAHDAERVAQHDFEDSMQGLVDDMSGLQRGLVTLRKTIAEKEEELSNKRIQHKETEVEKVAIENYLVDIKPGCDFITTHFTVRESNRANEKAALTQATTLLEASPAYKTAVADAERKAQGKCADTCDVDADHANCKACLAGVTVPGYCAGHSGITGC